jgi:hypothetical protein
MGHVQRDCPDIWRRFHRTLEGETPVSAASEKHQTAVWCCNCGRRGHLAEDCRRFAYSPYPRTSLRIIRYAAPTALLAGGKRVDGASRTPAMDKAAEKANKKAEKRRLKKSQYRTCPNSPQVPDTPPPSKRFRSEANSPPAGPTGAQDFIRYLHICR